MSYTSSTLFTAVRPWALMFGEVVGLHVVVVQLVKNTSYDAAALGTRLRSRRRRCIRRCRRPARANSTRCRVDEESGRCRPAPASCNSCRPATAADRPACRREPSSSPRTHPCCADILSGDRHDDRRHERGEPPKRLVVGTVSSTSRFSTLLHDALHVTSGPRAGEVTSLQLADVHLDVQRRAKLAGNQASRFTESNPGRERDL